MKTKSGYIIILMDNYDEVTKLRDKLRHLIDENMYTVIASYSGYPRSSPDSKEEGFSLIIEDDAPRSSFLYRREICRVSLLSLNIPGFFTLGSCTRTTYVCSTREVNWISTDIDTYGKCQRVGVWKSLTNSNGDKLIDRLEKMKNRTVHYTYDFLLEDCQQQAPLPSENEVFTSKTGETRTFKEWKQLAINDFKYIGIPLPKNWWANMCKLLGFNYVNVPLV